MTTLFASSNHSAGQDSLPDCLLESQDTLHHLEEAEECKEEEDMENYLPLSLRTTSTGRNSVFNSVEVIAPSSMPGGYQFPVQVFGQSMIVEVVSSAA